MKARVTVLCENSAVRPMGIIGEHGFAALIERGDEKVLFDTGQGYALLHNARIMGFDLAGVNKVALSHGHYDHTGGLAELLKAGGERDIYAHPGIFVSRYWKGPDGSMKPIGIPFNRDYLEGLGARFRLDKMAQEVADGISTTGEIDRVTPFEGGDTSMFLSPEPGGEVDPLPDDLSLVVEGEAGLIVLLGCAHAGLVNILKHVEKMRPGKKIHAVLGGTHLGFSSEEQMAGTIEAMKGMGVEKVGASHCTGLAGSCRLREAVGDEKFFFAGAGAVLEA
ncbi:MAG TPA: MBL fold metallo-hydrolase [Proteobacteria bacterium]|nr:ribonuclease Z [bacterium BMS3Abin14]HDL52583.1 MBL fold metallo-hydrolase [Pseudomonadota bacterium]